MRDNIAAPFAIPLIGYQVSQRNISRTSDRTGTGRRKYSKVAAPRTPMLLLRIQMFPMANMIRRTAKGLAMASSLRTDEPILVSCF